VCIASYNIFRLLNHIPQEKDNIFATLCCDTIQYILSNEDITIIPSEDSNEVEESLDLFESAVKIICDTRGSPIQTG
jgi:hypothetical protein